MKTLDLFKQHLKEEGGRVELQDVAEEESEGHVEKEVSALSGVVVFHLLDNPGRYVTLKNTV